MPEAHRSASEALDEIGRFALDFRLICIVLGLLDIGSNADPTDFGTTFGLLMALLASFVLLLRWANAVPLIRRFPVVAVPDLLLALSLVYATGVDGAFGYYMLGTALLAGLLFGSRGALLLGGAGVLGWWAVAWTLRELDGVAIDFHAAAAMPAFIALAATGGAGIRSLLLSKADTEEKARSAEALASASEERTRLAREMHDTLGKTLHGIALSASALPAYVEKRPEAAMDQARQISRAATAAAKQARQLLSDLRSDRLTESLPEAVKRHAHEWGAQHQVEVEVRAAEVSEMSPGTRYELFAILRESLHNVAKHAAASTVAVTLSETTFEEIPLVCLEVRDDGVGLPEAELETLAATGHFGLVGMHERAGRVGGRVTVNPAVPRGTEVFAWVPATSAVDMVDVDDLARLRERLADRSHDSLRPVATTANPREDTPT